MPDQITPTWTPALDTLRLHPNLRALVDAWLGIGRDVPASDSALMRMTCCEKPNWHRWLTHMVAWCLLDEQNARQVVNPCIWRAS